MLIETTKSEITQGSFSGHETFPLRYTWLHKAVQHVGNDPEIFGRDDALVKLGVGKNMVRAIRHWAMVSGMLQEDSSIANNRGRNLEVSDLGRKLLAPKGWDPFLEDPATFWLIHWQLATQPSWATTWYWVFNLAPQSEFSKDDLFKWLSALVEQRGWSRIAPESLKRDIDCFVRTYVASKPSRTNPMEDTLDCPLVELGLLRELGTRGSFAIVRDDHRTLPDAVFFYALLSFLKNTLQSQRTIPLEAVAFSPGSPGRVFALTEEGLMRRLERLAKATNDSVSFDETAGLRQLLIRDIPEPTKFLSEHYKPTTTGRRSTGKSQ